MRTRLPIFLVFAVAAFLLLAHLGAPPLDEAEARSAIVSRHILTTGQWLWPVPPKPFACEKSPLAYWQAVPFAWLAGGVTELAARLPSVLWALALLFLTWGLARRWHGDLTALLSAGALATSYGCIHWGRHGSAEMAQAATILWCLWHFAKHRADAGRRWLLVFGLLVGLAANFGAREAYGVVILGAVALSAMARDWAWLRPARTVALAAILSLAVFLALPLAASVVAGSAEPFRALWREQVARHLQPLSRAFRWDHDLWRLVTFCAPWVLLVPLAWLEGFLAWRRGEAREWGPTLLAGAALAWLALSVPAQPRHLLAVAPFASIIAARLLAQFSGKELGRGMGWAVRGLVALAGVLLIGACGLSVKLAPGWEQCVPLGLAGLALIAAAALRSGHTMLGAAAALWAVHVAVGVPRAARQDDIRDQAAKVAAQGKPIALLGKVPPEVCFYLDVPCEVLDGPAAQQWAQETGGLVVVARKPDDPSWQTVAEGRSWRALAWDPKARAVRTTRDPAWLARHPLHGIKGERLTYAFSPNFGTVTMRLAREDARGGRQLVITAESKGGIIGYPMASTITSRLRDSDLAQTEADDLRTKPSYKHRRFTWLPEGVDYRRHDHCKDRSCREPLHMVARRDGTKAHCADKRCTKAEHRQWRLKEAFRVPGARDAYHVIAACYIARGFDLRPGQPPQVIRVINNQSMWDVALRAVEERTVQVPAGRFECLKLAFDATPVNKEAKESADEAEGPFGLTGHADLYVDKATKLLVLLDGEIELGTTFKVQVMLASREAEAMAPAATPAQ